MIDHPHNAGQSLPDEAALEIPPAGLPAAAIGGSDSAHTEAESQAVAANLPPNDTAPAEVHAASESSAGHQPAPEGPHHLEPEAGEPETSEPEADAPGHVEAIEEEEDERGPIEEIPVVDEPPKMNWYILKVQSNREESIRESLKRRVAVAGLERYVGDIIVPTEMVSEFKGGKKRVVKRKLYPGYLVVHMEINEDTWFLVRETPGIGDFTGSAGKPTPMLAHEVSKIVAKQEEKTDEAPKLKINFNVGDRVKINEGTFENFEGEVDSIDEASGRVTVMINIFGRSTPVELEYWQIETI